VSNLFEEEPEYRETLQVFDEEYLYLGFSGMEIYLENPESGQLHEFGFWEFIEGRMQATGQVQ